MTRAMSDGLARDGVRALALYAPDDASCAVDLSDNTNLWGAPPAAMRAVRAAPDASFSRYPTLYGDPLGSLLLSYVGLAATEGVDIVTGCGSDDVLDSAMRAFGAAGDCVAFCAPTFSMIPYMARLNELTPVAIPFTAALDIDAQRLVDSKAKLTYLCTPNNPTGTAASREAIAYVVQHARGIVIIDEAYAEFAPDVFVDLVAQNPRVIVARTFSKAFGMAGLRVGYGVCSTDVARLVKRARGPYKVTSMAERAVRAALSEGPDGVDWVREHAELAKGNRTRLIAALEALGLPVFPSAANFVLVPTPRAEELARAMVARGVLVRSFTGLPRDVRLLAESEGAALRIGVGPWEMMQTMLDTLGEVL